MIESFAARKYLQSALPLGSWAAASYAIGRDHAYIQQHIRRGSPRFLAESDRNILVRLYDLDPERLKPPPKSAALRIGAKGKRGIVNKQGDVEADTDRVLPEDPERAELLRIWARLTRYAKGHERQIGLRMLGTLADTLAAEAHAATLDSEAMRA